MATYGGDLSLQRFLALESRAVPFDAAHAIGNATLALIAGPAMIRMLARFRERFEWRGDLLDHRYRKSPRRGAVTLVLLLALALVSVLPARAQAADADPSRAAAWLVTAQNADGGWGTSADSYSSTSTTAWVMLGLEATGRNPLDVSRGGHTPVDFLRARVNELGSPGDFARTILALEGAGVDPRDFGGHDLVEALLKRRRDNGSYEGWPGSTSFATIALRSAGATGGLDQTTSWLAKAQNGDGGWGDLPKPPSTADGTGAVMQAIPATEAARHGMGFLRNAQRPNGGFPLGGNGSVNSQSTAWAVQGMLAVGTDPASVTEGGKSPLDYLAARQEADGHYRYSDSSDQTPVWVTGQVLTAVAGESFPVPAVPRTKTAAPSSEETSSGSGAVPAPPADAGSSQELLESFEESGAGGVPSTGGTAPAPKSPGAGTGALPAVPPGTAPEGDEAESPPAEGSAAPAFEASDGSAPEPWIPIGVGLATAALALGSVLLLGRRFSW
jgi:hypothetical protein